MTSTACAALIILFGLVILIALAWAMWPTEYEASHVQGCAEKDLNDPLDFCR